MMVAAAFWLSALALAWTYVGFGLVCLVRAVLFARPVKRRPIRPTVSVVLAARNEEAAIAERIENLMGLDYPVDRLEIIVASDGSTDETVDMARRYGSGRVRVLDLPPDGKARALTRAVEHSSGKILVFTDANTRFRSDALAALVAPFADPDVGGVAGDQRYLPHGSRRDGVGERTYWDVDRVLKTAESAAGNTIAATGAIYAIRRELFEPIADGVTDDFITSTAVIARGKRLVFEPAAVAEEPVASDHRVEFGRKVRIMTRGLRGVALRRGLLDPRVSGFYAVQLLTHKVLRRLMVFPIVVAVTASFRQRRQSRLHAAISAGTVAIATLGIAGLAVPRTLGSHPAFALPAYFLVVNAASLVAAWNLARGRRIVRWEPQRPIADRMP
jgi:cellulose synthase/poly-beta-1,6-N-acetylglucosamine synthase-like glycosyltransferase